MIGAGIPKAQLMDSETMARVLTRMERAGDLQDLILVGIRRRGVPLAQRLADVIEKVERGIRKVGYVTGRLSEGESALDLVREVLGEFEIEVLETCPVEYRCYCTRDRVVKALVSMGSAEMRSLIDEQGSAELTCQFCDEVYKFSREDLEQIYRDMQPDKA